MKFDLKSSTAGFLIFWAVIFLITPAALALAENPNPSLTDKISQLSNEKLWLRLLHLASSETPVISSGFYLSATPPAHIDPKNELESNLREAQNSAQYRCRFPARDEWLRDHFPELSFAGKAPCADLDTWRNSEDVSSISLVYPDRNMQTSLGVFSHTFLKLNLSRWSLNSNLNIALGFAAELNPQEPMVKMISKGLSGGYIAKFTFSTYDTEVSRYGESESRDIFEYELNLTKKELNFLLNHTWELQDAEFHYYFLNGNCSYHLLTLLEIARPGLDLTSHFHFVTVPSTSLRVVLQQENLIKSKRWIPGKQTRENQMLGQLSPKGKTFFKNWRHQTKADRLSDALRAADLSAEEEMVVLDLLAESSRGKSELAGLRKEVLNRRSLLPRAQDSNENFFPKDNPETAHGVELIGGGYGGDTSRSSGWFQLRYRQSLHNMMDPPEGYFKNSTFELADIRLRYSSERQFENSSVTLFNAVLLLPSTDEQFHFSWQARSRVSDVLKFPTWQNGGGLGWAKEFGASTFYTMAIADSYMDKNEKLGLGTFAGASVGLALNVFDHFRIRGNLDQLWPLQSNRDGNYYQGELQAAYSHSTSWSVQLDVINSWREQSIVLETLFYY